MEKNNDWFLWNFKSHKWKEHLKTTSVMRSLKLQGVCYISFVDFSKRFLQFYSFEESILAITIMLL